MANSEGPVLLSGEKTVAAAGTAEALVAASQRVKSVVIIAKGGNTNRVYVGASDVAATTNDGLGAGQSLNIEAVGWLDLARNLPGRGGQRRGRGLLRGESMTSYVECPHCRVRYPLEKLYADRHDQPPPGKSYTIVCAVCHDQFDTSFRRGWSLRGRTLRALVKTASAGPG